jgi:uncharacterized membrane protein HdeD (DUF308 family)
MIYEGLNSLRRSAIMTTLVLLSFGVLLLIMPEAYLPSLILAAGSVMIILSLGMVFDFISSNKALIHYVYLTSALALGIAGIAVIIYMNDIIFTIGFFFGLFLILESIHGIYHSWVYAKRSGRSGWWMLIPLYVIQIVLGFLVMLNPCWSSPGAFKQIIGAVIVFASIVSTLKLVFIWPLRKV